LKQLYRRFEAEVSVGKPNHFWLQVFFLKILITKIFIVKATNDALIDIFYQFNRLFASGSFTNRNPGYDLNYL